MCSYLFHSPLPHRACARGHCPLSCSAAASPLLSPWLSLHCLCLRVHCLPVSCVAPQVTWNTSSSSLPRKGAPYISFCSPRRGSSWLVKTLIPWILWEKKKKTPQFSKAPLKQTVPDTSGGQLHSSATVCVVLQPSQKNSRCFRNQECRCLKTKQINSCPCLYLLQL